MYHYVRFPGGKDKALTLSYDDGVLQDARLIQIMKSHGLKGTFNLNSGLFALEGSENSTQHSRRRLSFKDACEVYKDSGMEVALHSLTHPNLQNLPYSSCAYEVTQDRINLEQGFDRVVRGMAYPYGAYSDEVVEVLKQCGVVYSRTVDSTENFNLPTDWLRLPPTCHHNHPRLMELADEFVNASNVNEPLLFYLWGHSYEFDELDNWYVIEKFAAHVGNRDDVWYATNIDIYNYLAAYHALIFSASGNVIYNPTCIDVYIKTDGKTLCIKSGKTISTK